MTAPRVVSADEVLAAYKQVFSTPEGQIVLADLLKHFSYSRESTLKFPNPLSKQVPDPEGGIYYREGQRTVVMHIGIMMDGERPKEEAKQGEM